MIITNHNSTLVYGMMIMINSPVEKSCQGSRLGAGPVLHTGDLARWARSSVPAASSHEVLASSWVDVQVPFDGSMQLLCLGRKDRQVGLLSLWIQRGVGLIYHTPTASSISNNKIQTIPVTFHLLDPSIKLWKKYRREKHNLLTCWELGTTPRWYRANALKLRYMLAKPSKQFRWKCGVIAWSC